MACIIMAHADHSCQIKSAARLVTETETMSHSVGTEIRPYGAQNIHGSSQPTNGRPRCRKSGEADGGRTEG